MKKYKWGKHPNSGFKKGNIFSSHKGKKNGMYQHLYTKETIEKQRKAALKRFKENPKSKKTIEKQRQSILKRCRENPVSEETKITLRKAVKKGKEHWKYVDGLSRLQRQEKIAGRKRLKQCEVCGGLGRICFDHDHVTGKFRGWICHRCNIVLGFVKDSPELLIRLSEYLCKNI